MESATKYHVDQIADRLVGGRITKAVHTKAADEFGDEFWGFEVKRQGKKPVVVWVLRDEEGNGPGALEYQGG